MTDETGRFTTTIHDGGSYEITMGQDTAFTIRPGRGLDCDEGGDVDAGFDVLLDGELFCSIQNGGVYIAATYPRPVTVAAPQMSARRPEVTDVTFYAAGGTTVVADEGAGIITQDGGGDNETRYLVTEDGTLEES